MIRFLHPSRVLKRRYPDVHHLANRQKSGTWKQRLIFDSCSERNLLETASIYSQIHKPQAMINA